MILAGPAKLLTVYTDQKQKWHHESLYMAIIARAHQAGLAGATAFHCEAGYGAHHRIHTANILVLSVDLPVVVQIVDQADRIQAFLPLLDEMVTEGMVTIQDVEVVTYRERGHGPAET